MNDWIPLVLVALAMIQAIITGAMMFDAGESQESSTQMVIAMSGMMLALLILVVVGVIMCGRGIMRLLFPQYYHEKRD